jgi:hypothetical protein
VKILITNAILLKGEDFQEQFSFFPEVNATLSNIEKTKILLIFNPNTKLMRFIECDHHELILKLSVEIQGGLAASTTTQLLKLITNHISNVLYSTGFCEEGGVCYWEGFFVRSALKKDSPDQLLEDLSAVETVANRNLIQLKEFGEES